MHIIEELIIDKNVEAVWEVMGNQYATVHLWSSNFKDSKAAGKPKLPGLDYLHRVTITDRGETIQELSEFDAANHRLAYHITKGAPKIAKKASGVWSLKKVAADKTMVILAFDMETEGLLGHLLTPLIKKKLRASAVEIAEELKYYVENGTPHPRKVNALEKLA